MTDAERHDHVLTLFQGALAQSPPEREAWVATASGDAGIRRMVVALLAQHEVDSFLDQPLLRRPPSEAERRDLLLGQTIGPWRVVALLGRGGMGAVYRAERADDSFRQSAALKLVRPGMGDDFHARFLRERALLAGLDHPGIARLLDGGLAPDGTPYLAMELVEGEPITTYAEAHRLDVRARLKLFLGACEAVAYAHRSLVVHRDIKPAHVLVGGAGKGQGGDLSSSVSTPSVKLLDFGVAKLLSEADATLTRTGSAGPLTPAYAAPEQLLGRAVTTATDVYALGVILYELLAGRRPYDLAGQTAAGAERLVTEAVPKRPSDVAPADRPRSLSGDLDAITLKALAKEPERRYASADALADDIRRHLGGEPVLARPATARYRAGRFIRRHAIGVAASVLVFLAMAVGAGAALWKAHEARISEERAEAIAGFLEGILRAPNGRWYIDAEAKGPDTPIRVVLAEAASRIDRDFADRPDLRADLHHIVGDTYTSMGLRKEALHHHQAVLAIRESLYTAPHPDIAEALYYLSGATVAIPEQVRLRQRAVSMLRQRPSGNNVPFVLNDLGGSYLTAGQPEEAEALFLEARAYVEAHFTPGTDGHRYRAGMLTRLAYFLAEAQLDQGDVEHATRWLQSSGETDAEAVGHYQCIWGRWRLARGERDAGEDLLLRCATPADPGEISTGRGVVEGAHFYLAALYDAEGRPDAAAPYRAGQAHVLAYRDTFALALAPPSR